MVKANDTALEEKIREFHEEQALSLHSLIVALDEAHISHYSSGCGVRNVTFEIFPASAYVRELLAMISLDRNYKTKVYCGFKDASAKSDYNPAADFMLYLRRWSHFAEQTMQQEGDSGRGVAAARVKLIIAELMGSLAENSAAAKPAPAKLMEWKAANGNGSNDFARLMRAIGLALEARVEASAQEARQSAKQAQERNYVKALAAAKGDSVNARSMHKVKAAIKAA